MVTVPVRGEVAALAATETVTMPLPEPVAPRLTEIHGEFDTAVQEQPLPEATLTLAVPPPKPTEADALPSWKLQGAGAAACWTVKVCPAIVTVPVRSDWVVFSAIDRDTVPFPVPFEPALIEIQPTFEEADQLQPLPAATDTLADPPV